MNPQNWYKYEQNLSRDLRQAIFTAKSLLSQGVGIYLQDRSSRICFAFLELTNKKVDFVLAEQTKYKKLSSDMAVSYQQIIKSWYERSKPLLKSIPEDISSFLLPSDVSTPHLKAMIKTHKPGNNVRLTFSSRGSCTQNLSSVLDHVYLKPTVTSDLCSRRLGDTRDALLFIESINNHLWDNNIEDKPYIYALDVTNFFPSVDFSLSMPAIKRYLSLKGFSTSEVNAVCKGLKVVRNGNFFRWRDQFYNQISGCALGDPDSCSYSDLSLANLLDDMVPSCETALSIQMDPFFKVYRDDGLGFCLSQPHKVLDVLEFFNGFNEKIQWTVPYCNCCNIPEVICPNYNCLNFWIFRLHGSRLERVANISGNFKLQTSPSLQIFMRTFTQSHVLLLISMPKELQFRRQWEQGLGQYTQMTISYYWTSIYSPVT